MKLLPLAFVGLAFTASGFAGIFSVSEKFSRTCPLRADGTFLLSNINGSVEIVAWDKNEISIEAEKRASSAADLARIHIDVDTQSDRVAVKTTHEKNGFFRSNVRGEVRYQIKVPFGVTLEKIAAVNSRIIVSGVRGGVTLNTVNGSIRASDLSADAKLTTVNGSIRAEFVAVSPNQQISIHTVNGACDLSLPGDASARVALSSVNGKTSCEFPMTLERSERRALRGNIGSGSASLKADTVNGSIRIAKLGGAKGT